MNDAVLGPSVSFTPAAQGTDTVPYENLEREFARLLTQMPDPAGGQQVQALEHALASTHGVEHAVAAASGTAALHLALLALGIGPSDEVLVPALTVMMSSALIPFPWQR